MNWSVSQRDGADCLEGRLEEVLVPESRIFCNPSRIANIYRPAVEAVVQEQEVIANEPWTISIRAKQTAPYVSQRGIGKKARLRFFAEKLLRGPTVHLGNRYFYDARLADNTNVAHLIQHHLTMLGLIQKHIGLTSNDILVVLDSAPAKLAVDVFALAGYENVMTNLPVVGNQIQVEFNEFFLFLPYVRMHCLKVPYFTDTPEKVFISRRSSRRIRNEEEIWAFLREQGYTRYFFEDIPLSLQWSIARNAREIVSIHGAALGSLAFRDNGNFSLVELFNPGFVADCFRKYTAVLGGRWVGCRGALTGQIASEIDVTSKFKKFAFDDFNMSPEVVAYAIERLSVERKRTLNVSN